VSVIRRLHFGATAAVLALLGAVLWPGSALAGSLVVTVPPLSAPEATTINGTIATFTDSDTSEPASNFSAVIDWGDGTPLTAGTIAGGSGAFTVSGSHMYADELNPGTITVTVTDTVNPGSATGTGAATISEADVLTPTGSTFSATMGVPFSGTVATFTDTYTANVPSDFTATINWGDGPAVTAGTVTGGGGFFSVSGTHTYTFPGHFVPTVTISEDAPGTATATAFPTASVLPPAGLLWVSASSNLQTERVPFAGTVGAIFDHDVSQPASNFTATIGWGDGTVSAGTVTGSAGFFIISGAHTYTDELSLRFVIVNAHDIADNLDAAGVTQVTVTEADSLTATGNNFSSTPGVLFSGAVATFADSDGSNVPSDFIANINWGDGTPLTAGTIAGAAGFFTVTGTHTYALPGTFTVTTMMSDDGLVIATATATGTASVSSATTASIPILDRRGLLALTISLAAGGAYLLLRRA
jgi:hypothetical protein